MRSFWEYLPLSSERVEFSSGSEWSPPAELVNGTPAEHASHPVRH